MASVMATSTRRSHDTSRPARTLRGTVAFVVMLVALRSLPAVSIFVESQHSMRMYYKRRSVRYQRLLRVLDPSHGRGLEVEPLSARSRQYWSSGTS